MRAPVKFRYSVNNQGWTGQSSLFGIFPVGPLPLEPSSNFSCMKNSLILKPGLKQTPEPVFQPDHIQRTCMIHAAKKALLKFTQ